MYLLVMQKGDDVCFGKTADVCPVAIRLLLSRSMIVIDARYKIKIYSVTPWVQVILWEKC